MRSSNLTPRRWRSVIPLLMALGATPLEVGALSTDKEQPIQMEADSVDIDDKAGISIYRGNVELRQGSIHMTADKVTVYGGIKKTEKIVAVGNPATFKQLPDDSDQYVEAHAKRMEYTTDSEIIELIDEARVWQGKDSFSSDRIVYDRVKSVMKAGSSAQGKQRVRVTIKSKSTKDDAE